MGVNQFKKVWYKTNNSDLIEFLYKNGFIIDSKNYEAIIWDLEDTFPENDGKVYIVKNGDVNNKKIISFKEYSDILKILDVEIIFLINKMIILFVFILLTLLFFLLYSKSTYEKEKLSFYDWWDNLTNIKDQEPRSYEIFDFLFKDINKKIEIYSVFGNTLNPRDKNILRVQYAVEAGFRDPSFFDINIIADSSTTIVFPYAAYYTNYYKRDLTTKRKLNTKNKFCLFAVNNGSNKVRNDFFLRLSSKYKQVDSCGKHLNNIDACPGKHGDDEYINFISNYKFMICFENLSQKYYFTEKLINAYYGKTIPIYWGCPNLEDYNINMESILYLKPDFTDEDVSKLIERIKILDNDDTEYQKMFEQTLFINGILPDSFDMENIRKKIMDKVK
jgi:hypothetical protein